jgi:hypothetical protein
MSPGLLFKIDVNMGYFDDKQVTKLSEFELKKISTEPEEDATEEGKGGENAKAKAKETEKEK